MEVYDPSRIPQLEQKNSRYSREIRGRVGETVENAVKIGATPVKDKAAQ